MQALQAELAAAQLEKQSLLAQTAETNAAAGQSYPSSRSDHTSGSDIVPAKSDALPPKAPPVSAKNAKPVPLRSLSWGSSSKPNVNQHLPQRRNTFNTTQRGIQADYPATEQQQHAKHQAAHQALVERWLAHEPSQSSAATEAADPEAIRQDVLQEVLQAVTARSTSFPAVDPNNLTVQVSS